MPAKHAEEQARTVAANLLLRKIVLIPDMVLPLPHARSESLTKFDRSKSITCGANYLGGN